MASFFMNERIFDHNGLARVWGEALDSPTVFPVRSGISSLASYPYVIVRLGCSKCSRKGQYRLARLAAKYSSEIEMTRLLAQLAGDCALWDPRHPGLERCGALFIDITSGRPPDDPRSVRALRVVRQNKCHYRGIRQ